MSPAIRAQLAAAARRYFAAGPWEVVGDDVLFGLHDLASGLHGCASVMGGAGLEFGLDVSLGDLGFTLNRKLRDQELDLSLVRTRADAVSVSITNAVPASREFRRIEPLVIERKKVSAPRRGYLTGWRLRPGEVPCPLGDEDGAYLARCLTAVAQLAEAGRLGKDPEREGPRTLVYELSGADGELEVRPTYRVVVPVDLAHPIVTLPADLRRRLEGRPKLASTYLLSIFTPPGSIEGKTYWMALLLDDAGRMLLAHAAPDFAAAALGFFEALAGGSATVKSDAKGLPREVHTDSTATFEALADAAADLGVRLVAAPDIAELTRARESLGEFMRREG